MRNLFCYLFGLNVALSYLIFKLFIDSNGLNLLGLASLIVGAIFFLNKSQQEFKNNNALFLLLRGILFGISHIMIIYSLERLSVSITLSLSISGIAFANLLNPFLLNDFIHKNKIILLVISIIGGLCAIKINGDGLFYLFSFVAGFFNGLNLVITRMLKIKMINYTNIMASTFLSAGVVITFYSLIFKEFTLKFSDSFSILILVFLISSVQLHGLYLAKHKDVPTQSIISLTRIFWAMILDYYFIGFIPELFHIIGSLLIISVAIYSFFEFNNSLKKVNIR